MALRVLFASFDNEINIKLEDEESTFQFEEMCCPTPLNISTVGELLSKNGRYLNYEN